MSRTRTASGVLVAVVALAPSVGHAQVIYQQMLQERGLVALFTAPFDECQQPDPYDPEQTITVRGRVTTQLTYIEGVDRADMSSRDRVYAEVSIYNPCRAPGANPQFSGCINSTPDDGFCIARAVTEAKLGTIAPSLLAGSLSAAVPALEQDTGCRYTVEAALSWRATDDKRLRWHDTWQYGVPDNGLGSGPLRVLLHVGEVLQSATAAGTIELKPWRDPITGAIPDGCALDPLIPTNVAAVNIVWSEYDPEHTFPFTRISSAQNNAFEIVRHIRETTP